MKLSAKEREKLREKRREKRSAFLTRMVDEFKKVGFIAIFFVCVGTIVWCMILYGKGVTPTVSPSIPCAAFTILGAAFTFYCNAASKDKDSMNKNGMQKNKDGTVTKAVVDAITNTINNSGGEAVG